MSSSPALVDARDSWCAVRVIMNTMSEVAESPAVLDDLVRRIAERFSPDKIILFGSRARGDAGPDSDIDLLVLRSPIQTGARRNSMRRSSTFPAPWISLFPPAPVLNVSGT